MNVTDCLEWVKCQFKLGSYFYAFSSNWENIVQKGLSFAGLSKQKLAISMTDFYPYYWNITFMHLLYFLNFFVNL